MWSAELKPCIQSRYAEQEYSLATTTRNMSKALESQEFDDLYVSTVFAYHNCQPLLFGQVLHLYINTYDTSITDESSTQAKAIIIMV